MSQEHHHAFMIFVKTKRRHLDWIIWVKKKWGYQTYMQKISLKKLQLIIEGNWRLEHFQKSYPFSNIEKKSAYSTCKLEKAGALTK